MEKKDVTCLAFFEHNVNGETFKNLFQEAGSSKNMAGHIWDKFADYNHSFLRTFGMADSANRKILVKVAIKWCKENDYPGKSEKIYPELGCVKCPSCDSTSTHKMVGGGRHCLQCGWDFDIPKGGRDLSGVGFIED